MSLSINIRVFDAIARFFNDSLNRFTRFTLHRPLQLYRSIFIYVFLIVIFLPKDLRYAKWLILRLIPLINKINQYIFPSSIFLRP